MQVKTTLGWHEINLLIDSLYERIKLLLIMSSFGKSTMKMQ